MSFTQAGFSLALVQAVGMLFALYIGAFSEKMGLKRCLVLANLGGTFGAGMLLQRGWKPQTLLRVGFIAMLCSNCLVFAANYWLLFKLQFLSAVLFSLHNLLYRP